MTAELDKAQRAHHHIRERIRSGEYPPGSRLVLSTIAAEAGMSAVPVREAIRMLQAEGVVTFEHNVGARVAHVDEVAYLHIMQSLAVVEGAATALAAPGLSDVALADADAVNGELAALLDHFDSSRYAELNRRFHEILTSTCPNPELVALARAQHARLVTVRDDSCAFTPDGARESVLEHAQLLELIRTHADAQRIEHHMREHRLRASGAFLAGRTPESQKEISDAF
ncbi:GntR family transcriptional regulator [Salinibacterium sp. ZJ70]|uniref:GntR family transcriptional regulator n=1 Tax=Salinibacterium sp. ZJ70 TaxID=2708084 RepID=UPI001421981D|nr:GntR family transcriptional regulator [Salinibacterium sp. ZJ70]